MPSHGRWLTPYPLGLDAGPNPYAFVSNSPLTHVDLYGLLDFSCRSYPDYEPRLSLRGIGLFGERLASATSQDYKQMGIGALHGVGDFAMGAFSAASYAGYGLSLPFRSIGWLSDYGSLSESWSSFRSSNDAFFHRGSSLMHRILPGDANNDFYRDSRWLSEVSLDVGTAIAGIGALKRGISLATQGMRISHNTLKESFLIDKSLKTNQIWTATKKRTPVQNAFLHWKEHGKDFPELLNAKQYVQSTKTFINNPPVGTLTKIRANGDIIFYDPLWWVETEHMGLSGDKQHTKTIAKKNYIICKLTAKNRIPFNLKRLCNYSILTIQWLDHWQRHRKLGINCMTNL